MRMVNTSDTEIAVPELEIFLKPGEVCDVRESYARPRRLGNGSRGPAIIETLAPQLIPADANEHKEWLKIPGDEKPAVKTPLTRVKQLEQDGLSPGMAEVKAQFEETQKLGADTTNVGAKNLEIPAAIEPAIDALPTSPAPSTKRKNTK